MHAVTIIMEFNAFDANEVAKKATSSAPRNTPRKPHVEYEGEGSVMTTTESTYTLTPLRTVHSKSFSQTAPIQDRILLPASAADDTVLMSSRDLESRKVCIYIIYSIPSGS